LLSGWLWVTIAILVGTILVSSLLGHRTTGPALTFWEQKTAQWYLMNGVFIHFLMDGLSVFHGVPALHDQYYLLDSRYKGDATLDVLSMFELFVMAPLCLILYHGVRVRAPWRHALQLATSSVQLMGTIIYLGPEIYWWKGAHLMIDWNLTFSPAYLAYFWFPVALGPLMWIFVPLALMYDSVRVTGRAILAAERTQTLPAAAFRALASGGVTRTTTIKTTVVRSSQTDAAEPVVTVEEHLDTSFSTHPRARALDLVGYETDGDKEDEEKAAGDAAEDEEEEAEEVPARRRTTRRAPYISSRR
jgi:hypothetical protein